MDMMDDCLIDHTMNTYTYYYILLNDDEDANSSSTYLIVPTSYPHKVVPLERYNVSISSNCTCFMSRLSFVEILSDQESEAEEGEIDIFGEKSKRETSPPFRVIHLVEDNDDDNKEGDDDEKEEGEIDIFEKKSQCTGKTKARAERRKRKREKAKRLSEQEEATEANGVNKASAIEVDDTDKDEMSFMPMDSGPLRKSAKINAVKSPYLSNFLKRAREPSVGLVPVLEPLNDLYLKNFHDEQAKSSFLPHERSDQDEEDNTSIGSASSNVSSSIQESLAVSFEVDPSRARLKVSQVPCELCNSDDLIKAARNVDIVIYKATPIFQGASADISTSAFLEIDNSSNDLEISMITLQNGLVPTQEIKVEKLDSASYSFPLRLPSPCVIIFYSFASHLG